MGVIVILGLGLFFALMLLAGRLAYRWANRRHWAKKWCWTTGILGAFAVWNTVFYETIPTNVAVQYLCATEATKEIYDTDQNNNNNKVLYINTELEPHIRDAWYAPHELNQILASTNNTTNTRSELHDYEIKWTKTAPYHLIDKFTMQIIGSSKNQVLSEWIMFATRREGGYGSDYYKGVQSIFIQGSCLPNTNSLLAFSKQTIK